MAKPPIKGIFPVCSFLSSGLSISLRFGEICFKT